MPIIECIELSKAYGKHTVALKNLNLSIGKGESFGLLGENGAGKSTLVRLLMGFIFPTSGKVRVWERNRLPVPTLALVTRTSGRFLRRGLRGDSTWRTWESWRDCGVR